MRLWNLETRRPIRRYEGHTGPITCLAVSADGRYFLSGSEDQTIRQWPLPPAERAP